LGDVTDGKRRFHRKNTHGFPIEFNYCQSSIFNFLKIIDDFSLMLNGGEQNLAVRGEQDWK
jgi:hypothetical protein